MSTTNLDAVLTRAMEIAEGYPSEMIVKEASAELAAIRARVAELENTRTVGTGLVMLSAAENDARLLELERAVENLKAQLAPKTCAGCKFITSWKHDGMLSCNNRLIAITTIRYPEKQSCIHWEPAEPAPGSSQE